MAEGCNMAAKYELAAYYTAKLREEEALLFSMIRFAEGLKEVPEHGQGLVAVAIGKAKLLMGGKMQTFRQLCRKCLEPSVEGDEGVVKDLDLPGYEAVLSIELTKVQDAFKELDILSKNGWVIRESAEFATPNSKTGKRTRRSVSSSPTVVLSAEKDAERRKRLSESKKLARERMRMQAGQEQDSSDDVLLFHPGPAPPASEPDAADAARGAVAGNGE